MWVTWVAICDGPDRHDDVHFLLRALHRHGDELPQVRGLHSSTVQLNLSHFRHKIHPRHPLLPPKTPQTTPGCTPYPTQSA